MTVTATSYTPITHNGNGSTSVFNITFQFYEIAVIHIDSSGSETEWTEVTHYTVSGGEGSTGYITVTTTLPATGEKLRIERRTSKDQPRDYDLDNAVLESALQQSDDRLAMTLQELDYDNRRRPAISKTNFTTEVEFPAASTGSVLSWASDGNLANTALVDLEGVAISALTTTASLEDTDLLPLYDNSAGDNAAITWANVKTEVTTALNLGALASLGTVGAAQIDANAVTLDKMEHGTSGDVLYYGASGEPFRLAKGTDDQILKLNSGLPSWQDGPTNGIWEHINTTEVSSTVSAVDFTDLSAYKMLRLTLKALPVNDATELLLRTSDDNGVTFESSGYKYQIHASYSSGHTYASSQSIGYMRMAYAIGNNTHEGCSGSMVLTEFNTSRATTVVSNMQGFNNTGQNRTFFACASDAGGTARDALRVLLLSGSISRGFFVLEGVKG